MSRPVLDAEGDGGSRRRNVLLAEDDQMVMDLIRDVLKAESYEVVEARTGREALVLARASAPDVMILDWGLPDISGADVCRELRRDGHGFPIVMLTARSSKMDVILGLELGADDYITKPFDVRELLARVGAQVRRSGRQVTTQGPVAVGNLAVDSGQRRAFNGDTELNLTYTEFNLLAYMATNANIALSRQDLLQKVWGYQSNIETKTVDAHVQRLRRKLAGAGETGVTLEPVPGVGYRLNAAT